VAFAMRLLTAVSSSGELRRLAVWLQDAIQALARGDDFDSIAGKPGLHPHGTFEKGFGGRSGCRMPTRITNPLALMKLTSSSTLPGAANPAVIGQNAAMVAREAATPRRQKACVCARTSGGKARKTVRMVSPEKTVSSTTAREDTASRAVVCCARGSQ